MTTSESGDVLERFFEALVQEITVSRPEYLTGPFTVAEIYQDIVPYRSHRDLIGVEMSGDYEDALIRLLCGEGDYLLLDSAVARDEMQRELAGPNPDTTLFREFAAVDVRLDPGRVPGGAGPEPEASAAVSEADAIDTDVAGTRASQVDLEAVPDPKAKADPKVEQEPKAEEDPKAPEEGPSRDGVVGHIETASTPPLASLEERASEATVSKDAGPGASLTVCHWCREALPVRDSINFCPFCGSDLSPSPCRECGEAMEAQWQFCVSCGTDVRG